MINCITNIEINSEILIENQIINSINNRKELLLINEETLIKINLNQTSKNNFQINKEYNNFVDKTIYYSLFLIILLILKIKKKNNFRNIFLNLL